MSWSQFASDDGHQERPVGYTERARQALGMKTKMDLLPLQPGEMPDIYADATDFVEQLNCRRSAPIGMGVTNFVAWHRDIFIKSLG